MKILKMTATFGKLENETLCLTDGLNILQLPNEGGKSTWSAFILAMLYGVSTSERAASGRLPIKEKYKPWSALPMQGSMELMHEGRHITIERTTSGRIPMGKFRAYDTETDQTIDTLTAENCGQVLLGAQRSVFERSAFFAQNSMALTGDAELEKRLTALVTTGDESVSFSNTQSRLRDLKNHIQHNKTGVLPQKRNELYAVTQTLAQLAELHRGNLQQLARQQALEEKRGHLAALSHGFAQQKAAQQLRRRDEAEQAVQNAKQTYQAQKAVTQKLPEEAVLRELAESLNRLDRQSPEKPHDAEKIQQDVQEYDRLTNAKQKPFVLWLVLCITCAIGAILGFFAAKSVLFGGISLALAAGFGILGVLAGKENRLYRQNIAAAQNLLSLCGVQSRDELLQLAAELRRNEQLHQQMLQQQSRLLGQVSMFCPEVKTVPEAISAVRQALSQHEKLRTDALCLKAAEETLAAVRALTENLAAPEKIAVDLSGYTQQQVEAELTDTERQLAQARSQADLMRGKAEALANGAQLMAQQEALSAEIAQLEQKQAAADLAAEVLEKANAQLQTRFSPRLNALAGELFCKLTHARYDGLTLDSRFRADARETDSSLMRELEYLSSGTADQAYLSVRLAIAELTLGSDAPLIMDDALIRFDDERLKTALALLREQSKKRQILLFTCQSREKNG